MIRIAHALARLRDLMLAPRARPAAVPLYALMHRPAAIDRRRPAQR